MTALQFVDKLIDKLTSDCREGCRRCDLGIVAVQRYGRDPNRG